MKKKVVKIRLPLARCITDEDFENTIFSLLTFSKKIEIEDLEKKSLTKYPDTMYEQMVYLEKTAENNYLVRVYKKDGNEYQKRDSDPDLEYTAFKRYEKFEIDDLEKAKDFFIMVCFLHPEYHERPFSRRYTGMH